MARSVYVFGRRMQSGGVHMVQELTVYADSVEQAGELVREHLELLRGPAGKGAARDPSSRMAPAFDTMEIPLDEPKILRSQFTHL